MLRHRVVRRGAQHLLPKAAMSPAQRPALRSVEPACAACLSMSSSRGRGSMWHGSATMEASRSERLSSRGKKLSSATTAMHGSQSLPLGRRNVSGSSPSKWDGGARSQEARRETQNDRWGSSPTFGSGNRRDSDRKPWSSDRAPGNRQGHPNRQGGSFERRDAPSRDTSRRSDQSGTGSSNRNPRLSFQASSTDRGGSFARSPRFGAVRESGARVPRSGSENARSRDTSEQTALGATVDGSNEMPNLWERQGDSEEQPEGSARAAKKEGTRPKRLERLERRTADRQDERTRTKGSSPMGQPDPAPKKAFAPKPKLQKEVKRQVYLPNFVTTNNLARMLGTKMRSLQSRMTTLGFTDVRPDFMLPFSDAELIAAEYDLTAIADEEAAFDLYPRPEPASPEAAAARPLRPPVVTIMGHVDHGKTTLLDKLRSTSVAAGEAGGITQHIGAFKVPVSKAVASGDGALKTVTFLDTPGHAAFSAMRSRGAVVTDIVVLVVAADDGVMPQTREVIDVVKTLSADAGVPAAGSDAKKRRGGDGAVQLVVALNKVDKPEATPDEVKRELLAAGVELEEFGGDVPCVEVSGKTGAGLPELEETLAALAEMAELRAEQDGSAEGFVLESRTEKGRGNIATVLIKRGELKAGDLIVAGHAYAKVRALMDDRGKPLKKALPGDPVLVLGWRELPQAGDELLTAPDEASAKRAITNRKRVDEQRRLEQDVEAINEGRRAKAEEDREREQSEYEERQRRRALRIAESEGKVARDPVTGAPIVRDARLATELANDEAETASTSVTTSTAKEYRLIVKADFSGTVEAVVGAICGIGNAEARVKVVASGVGDVSEGDVDMAAAVGGHVLAFNLTPSKAVLASAARRTPAVTVRADDVIYRLMAHVTEQVEALLEPRKEHRVTGEATVQQVFPINVKGRVFRNIAGCRVSNGLVARTSKVRILRAAPGGSGDADAEADDAEAVGSGRRVLWTGDLESVKHLKNEVGEVRKGMECGLAFRGFQDLQPGDVVQCFHVVDVPRHL